MAKAPAFQWYPGDHRRDVAVSACSYEARALWREMLDLMHDGRPRVHLTAGNVKITPEQLARMIGVSLRSATAWLAELEERDVFSRTDAGVIFSRRMVRDEAVREKRAAGGAMGGNPALLKDGAKGPSKVANEVNYMTNLRRTPATRASAVAVAVASADNNSNSLPAAGAPGGAIDRATAIWDACEGGNNAKRRAIAAQIRQLCEHHSDAHVISAWQHYLQVKTAAYASPDDFSNKYGHWLRQAQENHSNQGAHNGTH